MSRLTDHQTRPVAHPIQTAKSSPALPVDAGRGRFADAITARIAATKRRLLAGGLLQKIEWGIPGEPDVRGAATLHLFDARRAHSAAPRDRPLDNRHGPRRRYGSDDLRPAGDFD